MKRNILSIFILVLATLTGIGLGSCSHFYDDLSECPSGLRIRFRYDYNLKFADAFTNEVKSVNVWAFDENGAFVWHGEAHGEALTDPDFCMDVPLGDGVYDFVAWCGLKDNAGFSIDTYEPTSAEELRTTLLTHTTDEGEVSDILLGNLYHGVADGVEYKKDPYRPSAIDVTIPLVKNTNDVRILLQHLDGSPFSPDDFSVTITYPNALLDHRNTIREETPAVVYRAWNVKYGQTTAPVPDQGRATETVAALMHEHSTSRLMAGEEAVLSVRRHTDNQEIIRINMTDYLLMVRGHYMDITGREIGEQEYLDRQDDYSMHFILDKNNNWYRAAGVFINSWAVVPPQDM